LSDAEKREQYDTLLRYGGFAAANRASGGSGGFPWDVNAQSGWHTGTGDDEGVWSEIFSRISRGEGAFGTNWDFGPRKKKGGDAQVTLEVSFEEAFSGTTKRVTVKTADGSSQQLDVKVPAGAVEGGKLRYKGKGGEGTGGGERGDLVIVTAIRPHELYSRRGADVLMELKLPMDDAALGASVTVPAPDGSKVRLKLPAGTQDGKVFLVKEKGAPRVNGEGFGNLRITVRIDVPEQLSVAEKQALEAYRDARKAKEAEK